MRILHIYKDYFPVLGGIENHIKMLAERQAARGHQVSVLVTSSERKSHVETLRGVQLHFAGRLATISSNPLSLDMFKELSRNRTDIAHLHFPFPWGEIGNYIFGKAHKTVLTYHSDIVRQKFLRAAYAPFLERILARVDTIIATSPNYVSTSRVLARRRDKCVVVPLGIDPAPFMDDSPSSPLGVEWATGKTKLLFVGKLRYYKGVDYLIRAMVDLPDSRLLVVGVGPKGREWENLARVLGIGQRVEFVGEVADADLPSFYRACDIFVLPCSERSEAFGVVQLEAMAAGKPIISCDVGTGVAWVNQDQVTGLVVPPRDSPALAGAIKRLASDKEMAARMGAAARKRVCEEFSVEKMVDGVMAVYKQDY